MSRQNQPHTLRLCEADLDERQTERDAAVDAELRALRARADDAFEETAAAALLHAWQRDFGPTTLGFDA